MHVFVCRTYSYDMNYESAVIAFIIRYRHLVNVYIILYVCVSACIDVCGCRYVYVRAFSTYVYVGV